MDEFKETKFNPSINNVANAPKMSVEDNTGGSFKPIKREAPVKNRSTMPKRGSYGDLKPLPITSSNVTTRAPLDTIKPIISNSKSSLKIEREITKPEAPSNAYNPLNSSPKKMKKHKKAFWTIPFAVLSIIAVMTTLILYVIVPLFIDSPVLSLFQRVEVELAELSITNRSALHEEVPITFPGDLFDLENVIINKYDPVYCRIYFAVSSQSGLTPITCTSVRFLNASLIDSETGSAFILIAGDPITIGNDTYYYYYGKLNSAKVNPEDEEAPIPCRTALIGTLELVATNFGNEWQNTSAVITMYVDVIEQAPWPNPYGLAASNQEKVNAFTNIFSNYVLVSN